MRRITLLVTALAAAAMLAGGCGGRVATLRYVGGPPERVRYDSATFQLARDWKVQVILFRRVAAPIGTADPDFEYVFLELPERRSYGWLREDQVPAYRWVRQEGRNYVWLGTAGQVSMRFADAKQHVHLDCRVTMEPVAGTAGAAYVLEADLKVPEDTVRTQSLINRYGPWLGSIVNPPPAAEPAPAPPPTTEPAPAPPPARIDTPAEGG